jgi:hypothetical protein
MTDDLISRSEARKARRRITLRDGTEVNVIMPADIDALPAVACGECEHWGGRNFYGDVVVPYASCDLGVQIGDKYPPSSFSCRDFEREPG